MCWSAFASTFPAGAYPREGDRRFIVDGAAVRLTLRRTDIRVVALRAWPKTLCDLDFERARLPAISECHPTMTAGDPFRPGRFIILRGGGPHGYGSSRTTEWYSSDLTFDALSRVHVIVTSLMNPPSEEDYRNARGMIVMCKYCRKTQCKWPNRDQWVLVEEFLVEPPSWVSHGLCPKCWEQYYPE
jgi:hypothetical protein